MSINDIESRLRAKAHGLRASGDSRTAELLDVEREREDDQCETGSAISDAPQASMSATLTAEPGGVRADLKCTTTNANAKENLGMTDCAANITNAKLTADASPKANPDTPQTKVCVLQSVQAICPKCEGKGVIWWMRPGDRPTSSPCPDCTPDAPLSQGEELEALLADWRTVRHAYPKHVFVVADRMSQKLQALIAEKDELKAELEDSDGVHLRAQLAEIENANLVERVSVLERLLAEGERKLATYVSIYTGDKELKRLLDEWRSALTHP